MNMVAGGEQSGYGILTVREQLWMFSQFYGLPREDGWRRVDELIEAVGLERPAPAAGQHALHRPAPEDELRARPAQRPVDLLPRRADARASTSPRPARSASWSLDWKAAVPGRTVLLTTHYMAEADELCERIAIVDHGRILAIGSPDELKRRVQRESIFRLELDRLDGGPAALARLPGVVCGRARGRRRTAGRIARP